MMVESDPQLVVDWRLNWALASAAVTSLSVGTGVGGFYHWSNKQSKILSYQNDPDSYIKSTGKVEVCRRQNAEKVIKSFNESVASVVDSGHVGPYLPEALQFNSHDQNVECAHQAAVQEISGYQQFEINDTSLNANDALTVGLSLLFAAGATALGRLSYGCHKELKRLRCLRSQESNLQPE